MNTCFKFVILLSVFSLLLAQAAAQCEYEIAERRPSPNEPSQSIEHLDQNDESRTFLDCVQWVIDEIPNAQALFWDEQGKCIGYVTFEEDLEYMGNVNSRFCVLPPREINFDDAFGPDCKKAVFNGMFRNTVSSKTHLGDFASMELCVAAGLESDLGIQAVMWMSGGRCLGYYDTNAHALFKLPLTMPMASFVCIIDEQMAENYMMPLQVCEPQFAVTVGQLEVASCESMEVKDDSRHCNNLFDGSLSRNVKDGKCFVTKSNYKGWLEVKLAKTSVVNKIVMLSKGNGDGLAGTIVNVCTDNKKNCQRFGKVYKVNPDKCTILMGDILSGNMVRFYIADSNLAICEMRIYGI